MNKLTIDLESRSPVDLRKVNSWVYAENPLTQIMCFAFKVNDGLPLIYIPDEVTHLYEDCHWDINQCSANDVVCFIGQTDIIEAHNLEFEISMWTHIMHKRYGFPDLRQEPYFSKLRCSASVAAYHALPRKLEKLCQVLKLSEQKDLEGHKLMMKMCKPRIPRKAEKEQNPDWANRLYYHEKPEELLRQVQYCAQDVNAEHCVSEFLSGLPPSELDVWRIDQQANWRGVVVDQDLCRKTIVLRNEYLEQLRTEFYSITELNPSQVTELRTWVNEAGVSTPSVDAEHIEKILDTENTPEKVRRVLEIRRFFAKSSLAKLDTALKNISTDGRMRSNLMYHGASTGRWSGKGMQLHNLPSRKLIKDIPQCTQMIRSGVDLKTLSLFYKNVQLALSSCIRGVLVAKPGYKLYSADFSSIEGRVLAWLAGDRHILQGYTDGLDMYKVAASSVYDKPYDEISKDERQVGKIPELGGGYQGGWRAYMGFARKEKLKPPLEIVASLEYPKDYWDWWLPEDKRTESNVYTHEEAAYCKWFSPIVRTWRENRPGTVNLWEGLENACRNAVLRQGQQFEYAGIWYCVTKDFLQCRLPSGRVLHYYKPWIAQRAGETRSQILYWGTDSTKGGAWSVQSTYGGKLTENVVQAIARDLMTDAMLRIDRADIGVDLLFTVHDEIVEEGPKGAITIEQFEGLMEIRPDWAESCPIGAEGWVGDYYRK